MHTPQLGGFVFACFGWSLLGKRLLWHLPAVFDLREALEVAHLKQQHSFLVRNNHNFQCKAIELCLSLRTLLAASSFAWKQLRNLATEMVS
jgi:hypothetical protein